MRSADTLSVMGIYEKVFTSMLTKAKLQEENTELWTKRIKLNQEKIDSLSTERKLFEVQHE